MYIKKKVKEKILIYISVEQQKELNSSKIVNGVIQDYR